MTNLPFPDVSVQLTQRRWRCVLDPNLALSPCGAEFARRLAPHAEVWLGTEFFNILDSARTYEEEPELLAWPDTNRAAACVMAESLHDWSRLRDEVGYGGSPLHWIGDLLRESCLPAGMSDDVVARWEVTARSLDACLPHVFEMGGPLIATMRDTVALSTVLPAIVLTTRHEATEVPALCQSIASWGVTCERLNDDDALVVIERDGIRRVLVQAGLAKFLWGGMNIAVLHLLATGVSQLRPSAEALGEDHEDAPMVVERVRGPWDGARAFWYNL